MLTTLWYNVKVYLVEHQIYVLAYFVLVGGISFSICYRMVRNTLPIYYVRFRTTG